MIFVKPERWPYFNFREQLNLPATTAPVPGDAAQALAFYHAEKQQRAIALHRHFAALGTQFKESLDAMTVCRLSAGGLARLKLGIRPGQRQRCFYRLEDRQAHHGWWQYQEYDNHYERGRPVAFVGQHMLYGLLHSQLARLDRAINGPHPVGTVIETAAAYGPVQPGRMQHQPYLIHTDGSPRLPYARRQSVLDVMDDSGLETEYVQGYRPDDNDPLLALLCQVAGLVSNPRCGVRHYEALRRQPDYQQKLADLKPRLWRAPACSVIQRSAQTPHTGVFASEQPEPAEPVLRAHIHDLYARP